MDSSDSLVCNSCRHTMATTEERSSHYKSEWHRYNVKRRCAGLQPIAYALFASQISQLQSKKEQVGKEKVKQKCHVCNKSFASVSSFQTHLQSNKHIKAAQEAEVSNAANTEGGDDYDDQDEDAAEEITAGVQQVSLSASSSSSSTSSSSSSTSKAFSSSSSSTSKASSSSSTTSTSTTTTTDAADSTATADDNNTPVLLDDDGNYILRDGEVAIPAGTCLFCRTPNTFDSIDKCVAHMEVVHSFFIPFQSRLVERDDMLAYLGEKIGIGHVCLYCNGRGRARYPSTLAVQQHMFDKGHCKIRLDTPEEEEEFMDFYDFEASNEDENEEGDGDKDEEEAGDDDDSSASRKSKRAVLVGMTDLGEALLSDGSTIGHRQYRSVYNQRVRVRVEPESVLVQQQYMLQSAVERGLITSGELSSMGIVSENADGTGPLIAVSSGSSSSSAGPSSALTLAAHTSMAAAYLRRKQMRTLTEGDEAMRKRGYKVSWWKKMKSKHDLYIGVKQNNQSHYRAQVML